MHIPTSSESNNNYPNNCQTPKESVSTPTETTNDVPPVIDFSLPLTNTFLNHWKKQDADRAEETAMPKAVDDSCNYQADNEVRYDISIPALFFNIMHVVHRNTQDSM